MTLSSLIYYLFDYTKVNIYIRYSDDNIKLFYDSTKAYELKRINFDDFEIINIICDDYNEISIEVKHV